MMRSSFSISHRPAVRAWLWATVALLWFGSSSPVAAEALVSVSESGITPGVVTRWSGDGRQVELTLRTDADPLAVASAIERAVDRVRAKVRAGKVVVLGKSLEELLPLLAEVEVGDDPGGLELAQAAAGDADFGSGSSLRAKRTRQVERAFAARERVLVGQVVEVTLGPFPQVRIRLRVLQGPRGQLGQELAKGRTITVQPVFRMKEGRIDLEDGSNRMNLLGPYLIAGDAIRVRVGDPRNDDGGWSAEAIARAGR
jgi:hypothetical protein